MDIGVEIRRLSALLHCSESDLAYLEKLGGDGLMQLRLQFQDSLVSDFEPVLSKLAGTASLVPVAISEKICTRYLGPTLTSYMSYYTPIKLASKLAKRFDPEFMKEVAKEQIPERAKTLLADFPVELMRPVTQALLAEQAWPTMGGFVDHMPAEKTLVLMQDLPNAEASLRISAFAQNKALLAQMVASFDDETLAELIRASLAAPELMREACLVGEQLPASSLAQLKSVQPLISDEEQAILYQYAKDNGFGVLASVYDQLA